MALTRVTNQVIAANALSADKIANATIVSRHLAEQSVELKHLASSANSTADVSAIQDNTIRLQANLAANVAAAQSNTTAVEARRVANIAGAVSTITTADLTASRALQSGSGGKIEVSAVSSTELGHLDGVTSAIQTQIDGVESRRAANLTSATFTGEVNVNDDLIVAGNLTVSGDTTTANSINLVVEDRIIMLANSVTGSPSQDIGIFMNRGNQGNAAFFYDEQTQSFVVADTKSPMTNTLVSVVTLSNLSVGKLSFDGADLNTAITNNVTALNNEDTALQARLTTNATAFTAEDTALQARITANNTLLHSNDFITFTRLNANLNAVSANVEIRNTQLNANIDVVQDNVATLGGGGTFFKPFMNVNVALGTSNVFFVGQNTTSDDNVLTVTLDGIVQSNSEFVMHHSNDTIQFKDASIPTGTKVTILSMIGVA
mgnify:FL=1